MPLKQIVIATFAMLVSCHSFLAASYAQQDSWDSTEVLGDEGDHYNSGTYRFTKRKQIEGKFQIGHHYVMEAYSHKFRPRIVVRNAANNIIARSFPMQTVDENKKNNNGKPIPVYYCELTLIPEYEGVFYVEITSDDISNGSFLFRIWDMTPKTPAEEDDQEKTDKQDADENKDNKK